MAENAQQLLEVDGFTSEMLELLFDQIPMGIVILSSDYRVLRYNLAWARYVEHYRPSIAPLLQLGLDFFALLPDMRAVFEPFFQRTLAGETVSEQALCVTTAEGATYWNIIATPIAQADQLVGIFLVSTDVTAEVEAQQALRNALTELRLSHELIEQRVDERTRELKTLVTVQQALTSSLNLDDVLHVIAREARRLTHSDVGAVFLPEGEGLVLAALSSEYPIDLEPGYRISLTDSITGTTFVTGKRQLVTDITSFPHVDPNAMSKARLKSILTVPLASDTQILGVLSVGNKVDGVLGAEDERLLMLMVPSVVIALENVRSYEHASETAAATERGRLARDLHDAVTQTLFSASLTAEVLPQIWARNPDAGMLRLEKLRELTRGALAEMRTLLLELRPAALVEMPLGALLRQLAEGIAGRSRIAIEVFVTDEGYVAPEVKTAFYRIAQEALNNVAKHSKAQSATVTLLHQGRRIELAISDNGIGFDPEANRSAHLGLRIMAERAEAINAILKLETAADQGTRITVVWAEQEL